MAEYLEYLLFRFAAAVARRLSFRAVGRVGALLGSFVFTATTIRKRVTLDNLRHAFPERSEAERRNIAHGAFRNYGIAIMEFLWSVDKSLGVIRDVVQLPDPSSAAELAPPNRGILFLSAHFGSWEFLIPGSLLLFQRPVASLVQRQRNKRVDNFIDRSRSRFSITIPMGVSSRNVLRALADRHLVILLGDQSGPREAVFIEFFGRPAATHRGAAAFALKTGAPIIMGFLVRQHDGRYELKIEKLDDTGLEGLDEEKVVELTRRHVAMLEKWIRRYPDHWLWMHKRWKHSPPLPEQA